MILLSDEVWQSIVKNLPAGDHRRLQKTITAFAEEYARRNLPDSYIAERKVLKEKNRAVADAARVLLKNYDVGMAWRPGMN